MFHVRLTLAALGGASLLIVGAHAAPGPVAIEMAPKGAGSAPTPELAQFYGHTGEYEPCAPYAKSTLDEKLCFLGMVVA